MDYGIPAHAGIDPADLVSLIASIAPDKTGHTSLRLAMATRWPQLKWSVAAGGDEFSRQGGLVSAGGERIADNAEVWIKDQIAGANGDYLSVWNRYKDATDIERTELDGTSVYAFAPLSGDTADYLQITIELLQEVASRRVFTSDFSSRPDDAEGLQRSWGGSGGSGRPIGGRFYRLRRAHHVAAFLAEMQQVERERRAAFVQQNVMLVQTVDESRYRPGQIVVQSAHRVARGTRAPTGYQAVEVSDYEPRYLARPLALQRLFDDWEQSSAGKFGVRLQDHWAIKFSDYTDPRRDERELSGIPAWLTTKVLPKIVPKKRESAYGLLDRLAKFDACAGHNFAWYFYMLHGNRVVSSVGDFMAEAAENGLCRLPAWDREILRRWKEQPYGF